ncbi:MAG: hypothetical protein GX077_01875 [Tissierellia bacterium]|nr:hypothetical protein [Tissierellia bacterium]
MRKINSLIILLILLNILTACSRDTTNPINVNIEPNPLFEDLEYFCSALGFAIHKFDDNWHLMMLEEENKTYLGWKLLAINNMDIDQVFNRAREIMSYDNEVWATRSFSNTINFRESLEYLGIIEKGGPILLEIEDDNGKKEILEINSMREEEMLSAKILSLEPRKLPKTAIRGIYSAMALNHDCYYIQYNSCQEAQTFP